MSAARILLVDDDQVALDALRTLLGQHGYETEACQDGAGALALVCRKHWDLLILDIGLPSPDPKRVTRFDGIKVLQWLARLHCQVPVLVFTSSQDPMVALEAKDAGALGVIHKGDPIEDFLQAIRKAITREAKPEPRSPLLDSTEVVWSDNVDRLAG